MANWRTRIEYGRKNDSYEYLGEYKDERSYRRREYSDRDGVSEGLGRDGRTVALSRYLDDYDDRPRRDERRYTRRTRSSRRPDRYDMKHLDV